MELKDKLGFKSEWRIDKFRDETGEIAKILQAGAKVEDVIRRFPEAYIGTEKIEGNVCLLEGLYLVAGLISGIDTLSAKWDSANARLGVGDSTAQEAATQTGLQGSNKAFKAMDAGYPQRAAGASAAEQFIEWRATFGEDEGNFAWNEYTIVNAADDSGVNLNRKVLSKGTKMQGETWTLSLKMLLG